MRRKKILFISGSIGLGHIGRDIEIAKALRLKKRAKRQCTVFDGKV